MSTSRWKLENLEEMDHDLRSLEREIETMKVTIERQSEELAALRRMRSAVTEMLNAEATLRQIAAKVRP